MARPVKMGLDYFPYDCNTDRKIKLLNRKFGLLGEGFYLNLLKMIYANGYYLELCEETIDDLCIEFGLTIESFKMMLDFCIQKNLFSAEIFENNSVITSSGIQKRFIEATKRRKENNKIDIYEVNANNNSISVNINTQRKEKKRKEKERKEEESKEENSKEENYFFDFLQNLHDFGCDNNLIIEAIDYFNSLPKSKCPSWKKITFERNLKEWKMFPIEKIEATIKKTINNGWQGLFPEGVKKQIRPKPSFDEQVAFFDKDMWDIEKGDFKEEFKYTWN